MSDEKDLRRLDNDVRESVEQAGGVFDRLEQQLAREQPEQLSTDVTWTVSRKIVVHQRPSRLPSMLAFGGLMIGVFVGGGTWALFHPLPQPLMVQGEKIGEEKKLATGGLSSPQKIYPFPGGGLVSSTRPTPIDSLAPTGGAGMTVECALVNPTTANGQAISVTRLGTVQCVTGDGQTVVAIPDDVVRQKKECAAASCTRIGIIAEEALANRVGLSSGNRDLSAPEAVKTNVTCARTSTGMRGNDVNGASTCTATGANGTVLITVAAANFTGTAGSCGSFYIRRRTGTGAVSVTYDGAAFTAITSSLTTSWRRVAQKVQMNLDTAILVPGLCANQATAAVLGFQLATSGDAVDVDFVQIETSDAIDKLANPLLSFSLSPVETVSAAAVGTHHDNIGIVMPAAFNNTAGCVGYAIVWGAPASRVACPQLSTDNAGGFFAYYDIPPNFWLYDVTNNIGPTNDGVTAGVTVFTENGWSGTTMFGDNSNGSTLSGAYDGTMIGGGTLLVVGSQFQIPGNPCWQNAVMSNIKWGASPNACHW